MSSSKNLHVVERNPTSLAMLKMEKNFIGVIDKGYSRRPYLIYPVWDFKENEQTGTLFGFVEREMKELHEAIEKAWWTRSPEDILEARREVADVSNTLDYLDEGLLRMKEID